MTDESPSQVFERLSMLLQSKGIDFQVLTHEPVYTSADSARVRGVSLHSGAKALVMKAEDKFLMVVLPADFSLDNKAIKRELNCKNIRFANQEEVDSLTTLKPGSIPPFGSLFNLPTYCDSRLQENEI